MLIVIEGVDASGKATQTKRLSERLAALGKKVHTVTFPDYESDSSAPVKMYLSGKLGETADSVNPYAARPLFSRSTGFAATARPGKSFWTQATL